MHLDLTANTRDEIKTRDKNRCSFKTSKGRPRQKPNPCDDKTKYITSTKNNAIRQEILSFFLLKY